MGFSVERPKLLIKAKEMLQPQDEVYTKIIRSRHVQNIDCYYEPAGEQRYIRRVLELLAALAYADYLLP